MENSEQFESASPEEMLTAMIAQNRQLANQVEVLTRRMSESGTTLEDDRPVADQTPAEARQIFEESYNAGKSRVSSIALAVQDRLARAKTREEKKEMALVAFGTTYERAERIKRLEKELAEAKGAAVDVEIPDDVSS